MLQRFNGIIWHPTFVIHAKEETQSRANLFAALLFTQLSPFRPRKGRERSERGMYGDYPQTVPAISVRRSPSG